MLVLEVTRDSLAQSAYTGVAFLGNEQQDMLLSNE